MSAQARPQDYARAIYDLALEAWTRQLGSVQEVLRGNAALQSRLQDSSASVSERLNLLESSMAGGLSEHARKVLGTLLEAGQLDQLDSILIELERLARRRPERPIARVTSAVPMTQSEQEALRAKMVKRFGPDLEFEFDVDPALIGGVRLRVGDQVIDGTVAGKLAALRDRLTS